ncbi:hypothetical protein WG78_09875 [Amantichitinum ursilacus]|uniref:Uncharacterized protein n=1 Tax=Amantichitinum ursilacus TaxID=857265 RepID=A0A0N1JT12_9NEIS|nr:hypothetical protein WG78_09875 [Amantichitinum ursilacus]
MGWDLVFPSSPTVQADEKNLAACSFFLLALGGGSRRGRQVPPYEYEIHHPVFL